MLKEAEDCALEGAWPMNPAACGINGGCPYRKICKLDPSVRERYLTQSGDYEERRWDPLEVR